MPNKRISLTQEQYQNLLAALSIRPTQYKSLTNYVDGLVATLPPKMIKDINEKMKAVVTTQTTAEEYLGSLVIIDSQKRRAESLSSEFENIARLHPALFSDTLDLVFADKHPKSFGLGKLIRSRMAIGAAKAGVNNPNCLNHYVSLFMATSSFDSEEVVRTFFESFPEYSKDVMLLSRLASSVNRGANMLAVKYADNSALPYLLNVHSKKARNVLEDRLDEASKRN